MFPIFRPTAAALLVAALAACSTAAGGDGTYTVEHPMTDETEARAIATTALEAFNTCDYAGWSASWDGSMKAAIREDAFTPFCEGWLAEAGRFESIDGVVREAAKTPGHVKYVFTTTWEQGPAAFTIVLPVDAELVSGVNLQPAG